jgi:hypothetical protein
MTIKTCPECGSKCDGCLDLDCGYKPCVICRSEQKTWNLSISVIASAANPGFYLASVHGEDQDILVTALSRSITGATANALEKLSEEIRLVSRKDKP